MKKINIKEVPYVFKTTFAAPLDYRYKVQSLATMGAELPLNCRYGGMLVYIEDTETLIKIKNDKVSYDIVSKPTSVVSKARKAKTIHEIDTASNIFSVSLSIGDVFYVKDEQRFYYLASNTTYKLLPGVMETKFSATFGGADNKDFVFIHNTNSMVLRIEATNSIGKNVDIGYIHGLPMYAANRTDDESQLMNMVTLSADTEDTYSISIHLGLLP